MDEPKDWLPLEGLDRKLQTEGHHLSTDAHGREILIGLTVAESHWLIDYRRRWTKQEPTTDEENARAKELSRRHADIHTQVMVGILLAEKPTLNQTP
jgi:hypothetical protein